MHTFRVWAPRPERVDVVLADRTLPMRADGDGGWWACRVDDAGPGTGYAFSLDGGPPRADPRSQSQPKGISKMSELVDQASFPWTDGDWHGRPLAGSVSYECHVGTFSAAGTFTGAIEHLKYLAGLGITAIELMPVAEFPGDRGWGYDPVSLFAPHHAYGGPEGLKRLIDAAHGHGLAVVIDVVYNHLGPSGNYLPEFGPYFTAEHQTAWGDAVNFDGPGSGEVRRFVIDNALAWLRDYHADGLRIDAVHAIADSSATPIMTELAGEVSALAAHAGKPLFLIAESDQNDPKVVRGPELGGYGLGACWADEWHHAVHATLTGERTGWYADFGSLALLAKALRQAWVHDGTYSAFRRRVHGASPLGLSGTQFVVCTQNHDQVGNRAAGDRSAALMNQGRLKIAAALLLTAPFVPMLFQGEEWGASTPFPYFTDHRDPKLARAVREGRRREFAAFGWDPADVPDPQAQATFEQAKLDWAELAKPGHADLLRWYQELIRLRAALPALTDPRWERTTTDYDEAAGRLTLRRGPVLVAVNLGTTDWTCPAAKDATLLATSDPRIKPTPSGLLLPPDSVAIATT
ncbi:MAG TPA: malto-oligosyltrehalose trehalohydrolase [Streptosporangiaceae bacterium]|nr:malto-oligosyltrehalose trehalohydrolase [Streptosporangiaceae bacterium]